MWLITANFEIVLSDSQHGRQHGALLCAICAVLLPGSVRGDHRRRARVRASTLWGGL